MRYLRVAAVACVFVGLLGSAFSYSLLGTKWAMGPNQATNNLGNLGTAGSATWSIMGSGLGMAGFDPHDGDLTDYFGNLLGGAGLAEEVAMINSVFDTWAAVSGFVNLGQAIDGNVFGGASQASGGHLGDIRIGLVNFASGGPGGVLAHAFQPNTEANGGSIGWTIGGDVHMDAFENWVDNPFDTTGDLTFDLYTVLLHEVGHSLGLGHSEEEDSVMFAFYGGGRRSLHADDIAGIQAIYGPEAVPEPATIAGLGLGAAYILRRRKKKAA